MRYVAAFVILMLAYAPAAAQDTPADWVRKLGSSNFAERDRAAKKLEELGKPAIPILRTALTTADLETQRRALLVLERIEDRIILDEILNATPVHLRLAEDSLANTASAIESELGLRVGAPPSMKRFRKLDTGVLPYWQAWHRFCTAAELHESDYASAGAKLSPIRSEAEQRGMLNLADGVYRIGPNAAMSRIELVAAPPSTKYVVDDRKSIRVRVRGMGMNHTIDTKTPHAVFAFEVRPEPRIEFAVPPRVELTKIVDATGKEQKVETARMVLASALPEQVPFLLAYAGEIQFGGLLHLKAIPWMTDAKSIKEMHGRLHLQTTVRPSIVEAPDVLKAVNKLYRGYYGVTVKVLEAEVEDDEISLRVHLDHLNALTPPPGSEVVRVRPGLIAVRGAIDVAIERLELRDPHGLKYRQIKSSYQHLGEGKGYDVELTYAAKWNGKDQPTLVLTKAPRTISVEMPFVVRDLSWN